MVKRNILIVDDEQIQLKVLAKLIDGLGHAHLAMSSGKEVIDFFASKKIVKGISCNDVDVMLLDISMPDIDGLSVLKQISSIKGDTQVIVLTADKNISLAVDAINCGAIDYIVKGEKDIHARTITSINNAIERRNLVFQVSSLERKSRDQVIFFDIIGKSEAILSVIRLSKKIVNSMIPVLIKGPSGSGKELLARAIHGSSARSGKPFVIVKCDLLKSGDAEEEIFGSERNLADSAVRNIGKLREANNGTIFFEKITSLKPDLQIKLLRFMQEGEFTPVDGKNPLRVNVRIISSASRNLDRLVITKKFREDLYYRLATFPITVPSLRERGEEDIKLLAESFCHNFSINENKKIKSISSDALYLLYNYDWEDNVRQLKNYIFRAVALCDGDTLEAKHFTQLSNKESNDLTKIKSSMKKKSDVSSELVDIFDDEGRCKTIETITEEVVKKLVDIYNGNVSEVAKQLDVGRSTVYRKLKIPINEQI